MLAIVGDTGGSSVYQFTRYGRALSEVMMGCEQDFTVVRICIILRAALKAARWATPDFRSLHQLPILWINEILAAEGHRYFTSEEHRGLHEAGLMWEYGMGPPIFTVHPSAAIDFIVSHGRCL